MAALPASLPLTSSVVTAISLAIVFQKIKYTPDFEARNSEPRSESVWSMYSRVKLTGDEEVGESEEAINVGLALLGPISHPEIEERVDRIVLLYEEYQCSLSPNDKVRTTKEDDVSSPEYT